MLPLAIPIALMGCLFKSDLVCLYVYIISISRDKYALICSIYIYMSVPVYVPGQFMNVRCQDKSLHTELLERANTVSIQCMTMSAQHECAGYVVCIDENRIAKDHFSCELVKGIQKSRW